EAGDRARARSLVRRCDGRAEVVGPQLHPGDLVERVELARGRSDVDDAAGGDRRRLQHPIAGEAPLHGSDEVVALERIAGEEEAEAILERGHGLRAEGPDGVAGREVERGVAAPEILRVDEPLVDDRRIPAAAGAAALRVPDAAAGLRVKTGERSLDV